MEIIRPNDVVNSKGRIHVPIDFSKNRKQQIAFFTAANAVLYGGAAGGGKTGFIKRAAAILLQMFEHFQIYIIRKRAEDLRTGFLQGREGIPKLLEAMIDYGVVKYNKVEKTFTHQETGSFIQLLSSFHPSDIEDDMKGHEIHVGFVDEATTMTPEQLQYIGTRLRMHEQVKEQMLRTLYQMPKHIQAAFGYEDILNRFPKIYFATNPTGVSHGYLKRTYLDNHDPMKIWEEKEELDGEQFLTFRRQYIPARIQDNKYINYKEYAGKILSLHDKGNAYALLKGDWGINLSSLFHDVFDRQKHVIKPFKPAPWLKVWTGHDWGSTQPFGELYAVECDGETPINGIVYPRGTIIVFAELYGIKKDNQGKLIYNKGSKESPMQISRRLEELERAKGIEKVHVRYAGSDLFNKHHYEDQFFSYASEFEKYGKFYERAAVGPGYRVQGWGHIRILFQPQIDSQYPGLLFTSDCYHLIRTIEDLPRCDKNPDDADTDAEDHLPDALRYLLTPFHKGKSTRNPEMVQKELEEAQERQQEELLKRISGYGDPLDIEKDSRRKRKRSFDEDDPRKPRSRRTGRKRRLA